MSTLNSKFKIICVDFQEEVKMIHALIVNDLQLNTLMTLGMLK
jgi:hypothetical protein